jgi:hypothetical protein
MILPVGIIFHDSNIGSEVAQQIRDKIDGVYYIRILSYL